jgi:hypothetical protein
MSAAARRGINDRIGCRFGALVLSILVGIPMSVSLTACTSAVGPKSVSRSESLTTGERVPVPTVTQPPPAAVLKRVEVLRADQAALVGPRLRSAQGAARRAQARATKELWRYARAMVSGCEASPMAFEEKLGALRAAVETYTDLLDEAEAIRARLPAEAAAVAESAKAAGITVPIDLESTYEQYDDFRSDAAARVKAVAELQKRRQAAHTRCLANKARKGRA